MTDAEKIAAAKAWFEERFGAGAIVRVNDEYFSFEGPGLYLSSKISTVLKDMEGQAMRHTTEKSNLLKLDARANRAETFAAQIMCSLEDLLPLDGETRYRIQGILTKQAYDQNLMIIGLPPEFDQLTLLRAEEAMREKIMQPLLVPEKARP